MANVTVKIPRNTYLAAKAAAKKRGCFIGKIISDAVTLYNATNPDKAAANPEPQKVEAA